MAVSNLSLNPTQHLQHRAEHWQMKCICTKSKTCYYKGEPALITPGFQECLPCICILTLLPVSKSPRVACPLPLRLREAQ